MLLEGFTISLEDLTILLEGPSKTFHSPPKHSQGLTILLEDPPKTFHSPPKLLEGPTISLEDPSKTFHSPPKVFHHPPKTLFTEYIDGYANNSVSKNLFYT